MGVDAAQVGDIIFLRGDATTAEVLEECFHFEQELNGEYTELRDAGQIRLLREIDAQNYPLDVSWQYGMSAVEIEITRRNLNAYLEEYKWVFGEEHPSGKDY